MFRVLINVHNFLTLNPERNPMVWCYYSNETYFAELLLTTLFLSGF